MSKQASGAQVITNSGHDDMIVWDALYIPNRSIVLWLTPL